MNVDSCGVRAILIAESQCISSRITLLHCRNHEGGEISGVLHVIPLFPVGKDPTRANPLDGWRGVS